MPIKIKNNVEPGFFTKMYRNWEKGFNKAYERRGHGFGKVLGFLGGGDFMRKRAENNPNSVLVRNMAAGANDLPNPGIVQHQRQKAEKQQYQAASRNMFHNVSRDVP
jgi:hypothetical protein